MKMSSRPSRTSSITVFAGPVRSVNMVLELCDQQRDRADDQNQRDPPIDRVFQPAQNSVGEALALLVSLGFRLLRHGQRFKWNDGFRGLAYQPESAGRLARPRTTAETKTVAA